MNTRKGDAIHEKNTANAFTSMEVSPTDKVALVAPNQSVDEPIRFAGEKFASKSVAMGLDFSLQCKLWRMIDRIPPKERGYLQIFDLSAKFSFHQGIQQHILHKQEQPPFVQEHYFHSYRPTHGKIIAFDDGAGCSTLQWEDEWLLEGGDQDVGTGL